ncbi:uncharacterized protein KGF55_000164 [Candida pseudojiufengensis]|uniref:uncharacterized protein n=1 Tax=Candida pseudojiufengensis TaxID=497109 RepID=UPI0022249D88|nr:uncharacterized protein KGF55_000164 [Candida pseudojiufengensis]KAI5966755.1 hypothetical protein KGF55_000164 [Candida pseudojiufengensis]
MPRKDKKDDERTQLLNDEQDHHHNHHHQQQEQQQQQHQHEHNHSQSQNSESEDSDDDDDIKFINLQIKRIKNLPWYKKPSVYSIVFLIGLLTFSSSSAEGARQSIIYSKAENSSTSSYNPKSSDQAQLVASFNQYLLVGTTFFSLIPIAKFGEISSIIGRKPFFIALIFSITISRFLQFLVLNYNKDLKFKLLLFANYISAISGSLSIITPLSDSYITDFTLPKNRVYKLSLASASTFIGQTFGPIFGNFIVNLGNSGSKHGNFNALKFEIGILIILCIYVITLFPESRNPKAEKKSEQRLLDHAEEEEGTEINPKDDTERNKIIFIEILKSSINIIEPLKILTYPKKTAKISNKHRYEQIKYVVMGLILTYSIYQTLIFTLNQIVIQYGQYKFNWSADNISYLLSIISISRSISLVFILPILEKTILKKWLGFKSLNYSFDMIEYILIILGLIVALLVFFAFFLSHTTFQFYLTAIFFSLDALIQPVFDSTIIKFFPSVSNGSIYGSITLFISLLNLISPILITWIYKFSIFINLPNLIYLFYGIWMLIFIVIVYSCKRVLKLNGKTTDKELRKRIFQE